MHLHYSYWILASYTLIIRFMLQSHTTHSINHVFKKHLTLIMFSKSVKSYAYSFSFARRCITSSSILYPDSILHSKLSKVTAQNVASQCKKLNNWRQIVQQSSKFPLFLQGAQTSITYLFWQSEWTQHFSWLKNLLSDLRSLCYSWNCFEAHFKITAETSL